MKTDWEGRLRRLRPRGAPSSLRDSVLATVAEELSSSAKPSSSWERTVGRLVSAALVLGVVGNFWAFHSSRQRLAELATPKPVPRHIAETLQTVDSVAGPDLAEQLQRQLSWCYEKQRSSQQADRRRIEQLIQELESI